MRRRRASARGVLSLIFLFTALHAAVGQSISPLPISVSQNVDAWFTRVVDSSSAIPYAIGTTSELAIAPWPFAAAFGRASYYALPLESRETLSYLGGSIGLALQARLGERVQAGVTAHGGVGRIPDIKVPGEESQSYGLYDVGGAVTATARLTAALSAGLSVGYRRLATPAFSFVDALSAGVSLRLSLAHLSQRSARLEIERIETEPVFPVLRSWYDVNSFGSVTIRNLEDGPIENVRVSFEAPEYMGGPRVCATIDRMDRGEHAEIPLNAVFDERVLNLVESASSYAAVTVEYSFYGSGRSVTQDATLTFRHRNAMTWADDRRASAFVSPTDPASLWFARYASSTVRDRMRNSIPANLQYAVGIFEALRLYGVSYVIDPNSAYIELSEDSTAIDYLQYPSETLMYRGGDCDDLTILYCSLLESAGIRTAFITIPGHIYGAFDIGLSPEEAREQFFDPGLLIFDNDTVWVPVEITMVPEGFMKAWRIGAKQWLDNDAVDTAALFAMRDNWRVYPPTGSPRGNTRFALPEETRMIRALDSAVNRFVTREMGPVTAEYEERLARERTPETLNEYGIVLARAGMLDDSWSRFREAADAGYPWAWNNLANVAFIRKDYSLAYSYYEWAAGQLPDNDLAILGMARASYELDQYTESADLYAQLEVGAPELAVRFGYLASVYGGAGRAWSMADRLATTVWSRPEPEPPPEPTRTAAAPPSDAAAAPAVAPPVEPAETPQPEPQGDPSAEPEAAAAPTAPAAVVPEPAPTATVDAAGEAEPAPAVTVDAAGEAEPAPAPQPSPQAVPPAEPAPDTPAPETEPRSVAEEPAPARRVVPPAVADAPPPDETVAQDALAPAPTAPDTVVPDTAAPRIARSAPVEPEIVDSQEEVAEEPLSAEVVVAKPGVTAMRADPPVEDTPVADPPRERRPVEALEPVEQPPAEAPGRPAVEDPTPEVVPEDVPAAPRRAPAPVRRPPATEPTRRAEREPPPRGEPAPRAEPASRAESAAVAEAPPRAAEGLRIRFSGGQVRLASGTWELADHTARMTDPAAMFAKLVIPAPIPSGPTAYEFTARSTGQNFVGFGIHVHGRGEWELSHYGGGESILVWITSDPSFYGDSRPRLQIYRSTGEVEMRQVAASLIHGSAFETRRYRVEFDPEPGVIRVYADGIHLLDIDQLPAPADWKFAALRALDTAEFSDMTVGPTSPGASSTEPLYD